MELNTEFMKLYVIEMTRVKPAEPVSITSEFKVGDKGYRQPIGLSGERVTNDVNKAGMFTLESGLAECKEIEKRGYWKPELVEVKMYLKR